MLFKCHWIVLYTVHFTAFCLGGLFFPDTVYYKMIYLAVILVLYYGLCCACHLAASCRAYFTVAFVCHILLSWTVTYHDFSSSI